MQDGVATRVVPSDTCQLSVLTVTSGAVPECSVFFLSLVSRPPLASLQAECFKPSSTEIFHSRCPEHTKEVADFVFVLSSSPFSLKRFYFLFERRCLFLVQGPVMTFLLQSSLEGNSVREKGNWWRLGEKKVGQNGLGSSVRSVSAKSLLLAVFFRENRALVPTFAGVLCGRADFLLDQRGNVR